MTTTDRLLDVAYRTRDLVERFRSMRDPARDPEGYVRELLRVLREESPEIERRD